MKPIDFQPAIDFVEHGDGGPPKQPFVGTHFSDSQITDGVLHGARRGSSPDSSDSHRLHVGRGAPGGVHVYTDGSAGHPHISRRKHAYKVAGHKAIARLEDEPVWNDTLTKAFKSALESGASETDAFNSAINEAEHALKDVGYDGYTSVKSPHQVFLFGDQPVVSGGTANK